MATVPRDQGVQRFFVQNDNVLAGAIVSADSVKPAENSVFPNSPQRVGSSTGGVIVSGDFEGDDERTLDVRILDLSGTAPLVSEPVYNGPGNPTIDNLASGALANQTITLTLKSLGTTTKFASAQIAGLVLRALVAGTGGNSITVSVDTSGITLTPGNYSVLDAMAAGQKRFVGAKYDFGASPLTAEGEIVASSPRFTLGHDHQVYRQYVAQEDGETVVYFDPPIARDVPAGAVVSIVTGTYSATVTDGVTPEVSAGLITLFDFFAAIADSQHIEVIGVVNEDRKPGGLGIRELMLRTGPYVENYETAGSVYVTEDFALSGVDVSSATATERVAITCTDNQITQGERWSVVGSANGALGTAISGVPFSAGGIAFTIPQKAPDIADNLGRISIVGSSLQNEPKPTICGLDRPLLGVAATAKTITLTYRVKAAEEDCECPIRTEGGPLKDCLGIEISSFSGATMDADYKTKITTLNDWLADFHDANATLRSDINEIEADHVDIELAEKCAEVARKALQSIIANTPFGDALRTAALAEWDTQFGAMSTDLNGLLGASWDTSSIASFDTSTHYGFIHRGTVIQIDQDTSGHKALVVRTGSATAPWTPTAVPAVDTFFTLGNDVRCLSLGDVASAEGSTRLMLSNTDTRNAYITRWVSNFNRALIDGEIDPFQLASSEGDDCWQDRMDEVSAYWDVGGGYLPMWPGVYYHSAIKVYDEDTDQFIVRSTQEFAFGLLACGTFTDGDTITLSIETDGSIKAYLEGDLINLDVIYRTPQALSGGVDGNDTHTWGVKGSVIGPLSDYTNVLDSEAVYSDSGLEFRILRGGIPLQVGDTFIFNVARYRWEYRFNDDAYSGNADVSETPFSIGDGLSVAFTLGPGTLFETGDTFPFLIRQPFAPNHAVLPGSDEKWRVDDQAQHNLTLAGMAQVTIQYLIIGIHGIPSGATITVELSDSGGPVDSRAATWQAGAIVVEYETPFTDIEEVLITLDSAPDAWIGWVWAGVPVGLDFDAARCRIRPVRRMARGEGVNPTARLLGKGYEGEVQWLPGSGDGYLKWPSVVALEALFDALKAGGDEPFLFMRNAHYPDDTWPFRWADDEFTYADDYGDYNPDEELARVMSAEINLGPYYLEVAGG